MEKLKVINEQFKKDKSEELEKAEKVGLDTLALHEQLSRLQNSETDLRKTIEAKESELTAVKQSLQDVTKESISTQDQLVRVQQDYETLRVEKEALSATMTKTLEKAKSDSVEKNIELQAGRAREEELKTQISERTHTIGELQQDLVERKAELDVISGNKKMHLNNLVRLQKAFDQVAQKLESGAHNYEVERAEKITIEQKFHELLKLCSVQESKVQTLLENLSKKEELFAATKHNLKEKQDQAMIDASERYRSLHIREASTYLTLLDGFRVQLQSADVQASLVFCKQNALRKAVEVLLHKIKTLAHTFAKVKDDLTAKIAMQDLRKLLISASASLSVFDVEQLQAEVADVLSEINICYTGHEKTLRTEIDNTRAQLVEKEAEIAELHKKLQEGGSIAGLQEQRIL
jgi:chromosome segregation ATPase